MMPYAAVTATIAASLAGIAWSRARTGEYCSPSAIVVAAWGGTFALFLLRLIPYDPVSARAAAIMLSGVGCLLAGIVVGERWTARTQPTWTATAGARGWIIPYALLGLAGTAWYLWLVHRHLGWRTLIENARLIRIALVTYQIPSAFLFLEFFCIVTVLLTVALAATGNRLRWWHWAAAALCLLSTWLSTDRTQFYTVFLTSVFVLLYRRGASLRFSRLLAALALAAVLLAGYFLAIGLWVGKTPELLGTAAWFPEQEPAKASAPAQGRGPSALRAVAAKGAGLYLYATGSYPAFSAWIEREQPYTWGLEAVYPVARALNRARLLPVPLPSSIPEASVIARKGTTEIAFNAYTFLYYPMRDLGAAGVVIYSLLIGVAAGSAYGRARLARSSPLHLLVVAQVSTALTLSVFVNKFNNTAAWYIFAFTVMPFLAPLAARRLASPGAAGDK